MSFSLHAKQPAQLRGRRAWRDFVIPMFWKQKLTRKEFLKRLLLVGAGMLSSSYLLDVFSKHKSYAAIGEKRGLREALFYEKWGDGRVKCFLCPEGCVLADGQRSFCRVREPIKEKLYTLVYELACSAHVDPIEKKPVFHMLPGTKAFSVATAGCNSRCKYCQNWTISQRPPEETANVVLSAKDIVVGAGQSGCSSIAYTYTEPAVFYEYMLETSILAKKNGIRNIMVTGGKINPEPIKRLAPSMDAVKVDFKGFNKNFLREVCAQDLDTILEAIVTIKRSGVWLELVNLIVPTLNDNMDDIKRMADWIVGKLGPDVPLHFSRFWPQYKLRSLYPTPVETLEKAHETAVKGGLHYVYLGNVPGTGRENTICPGCGSVVVRREGFAVLENKLKDGSCPSCSSAIAGVWK